ncbi:MAG: dihydroorotase [Eubacterium sp.]|nr:dihydroorotase [Eubacterium sp.]
MSKTLLITNGYLVDPADGTDGICHILVRDGRIAGKLMEEKDEDGTQDTKAEAVSKLLDEWKKEADRVLDAEGCYIFPGLIDLHVHLRDPGQTQKEDIETGSMAAAHGGFTTICAMPNTSPVIDTADKVDYVNNKAKDVASVHVLQYGAITKGEKSQELADLKGMAEHGAAGFSEDGKSVYNAGLMLDAMKTAESLGLPVMDHCEDLSLRGNGVVNEDEVSRKEGLPGIPNAAEDVIIARDIILAREAGVHLHLCHCSTEGGYKMLKLAKAEGIRISGEVMPHNFILTSADRIPGDPNFKMNPPLRTAKDRDALRRGLKDGTFEVIATDHAPHTAREKGISMLNSPFGIVGLETCLPLSYTELVLGGVLTLPQMVSKLTCNPARILGLENRGSLKKGFDADLVIFDGKERYRINADEFLSRSRNTPFNGREVQGRVKYTVCGGKVVYEDSRQL